MIIVDGWFNGLMTITVVFQLYQDNEKDECEGCVQVSDSRIQTHKPIIQSQGC